MDSILLIDDDIELCQLMEEYLEPEGFLIEKVHTGRLGVERALAGTYSLVVLDVMLPELNGFDVLRQIRARSKVPVLMLTARGEDVDRIVGLEIGADDYLSKPFNPRELLARMRAILRRTRPEPTPTGLVLPTEKIQVNDVELDPRSRTVRRGGKLIELTTVEFDLLDTLLRAAGNIVSREHLCETALGRSFHPFDRSIDMHISNLRKKLGARSGGQERIKSIRGVGYIYTFDSDES